MRSDAGLLNFSGLSGWRTFDRNYLILLLLPLFLVCLDESWMFRSFLYITYDSWFYFGYFLDLKHHLKSFSENYYGTRLPWILPGSLVYQLFSPLVANYVLHLTLYYAANFSLYQILKRLVNQKTALLMAVLMGCHCFFLAAVGSKYIHGAGLTYFLLTLLMLTPSEKEKYPRLRLCLAGGFYGCLVYTQLFLLVYTPLIILYRLFINRQLSLTTFKFCWGYFALGFVGLTLFLCTINATLNGNFFFFMPIINWSSNFVSHANPWWAPFSSWWKSALWLFLPAITFCGNILTLVYYRSFRSSSQGRAALFFQIYFISFLLIYVIFEFVLKHPILNFFYYVSYLIPAMFLTLGSQLSLVVNTTTKKQFYWILVSIIGAFYLCHAMFNDFQRIQPLHFPYWLLLLLGAGGIAAVILSRYKKIGLCLFLSSLLMINMKTVNPYNGPSHISGSEFHKTFLFSVIDGVKTVQKIDRQGRLLFWYDTHEPLCYIFRAIASNYLGQHRLLNEEFPQTKDHFQSPTPKRLICIISEKPDVIEPANQNLASFGLKGEIIHEETIQQRDVNFKMTFLKIHFLEKN
jgi:hypothetical protein